MLARGDPYASLGPGVLFPPAEAEGFAARFLAMFLNNALDLFNLWSLALCILGMSVVSRLPVRADGTGPGRRLRAALRPLGAGPGPPAPVGGRQPGRRRVRRAVSPVSAGVRHKETSMARGIRQDGRGAGRGRGARAWRAAAVTLAGSGCGRAGRRQMRILSADEAVRIALERNPGRARRPRRCGPRPAGPPPRARRPAAAQPGANYNNTIRESIGYSSSGVRIGTEFWSGRATLDQTLISFPTWASIRAADSGKDAALAGNQAARADIALDAYRQVLRPGQAYKYKLVTSLSVKLRQDQLVRTQALFDLGSVARGDVLKQQVTVSQAQQEDIAAGKNIIVQRALLAAVLGLDVGTTVDIDTTLTATAIAVDSAAVFRDALRQRPSWPSTGPAWPPRAPTWARPGRPLPVARRQRQLFVPDRRLPRGLADHRRERPLEREPVAQRAGLRRPVLQGAYPRGRGAPAPGRVRPAAAGAGGGRRGRAGAAGGQPGAGADQRRARRLRRRPGDLKLTQEKYNVGSATVIELVDSQVSATSAAVDLINALADAHIAEMQLKRARATSSSPRAAARRDPRCREAPQSAGCGSPGRPWSP